MSYPKAGKKVLVKLRSKNGKEYFTTAMWIPKFFEEEDVIVKNFKANLITAKKTILIFFLNRGMNIKLKQKHLGCYQIQLLIGATFRKKCSKIEYKYHGKIR